MQRILCVRLVAYFLYLRFTLRCVYRVILYNYQ